MNLSQRKKSSNVEKIFFSGKILKMVEILVSFLGIIFLVLLHEFSHFLVAKKSNVKVLEFGVFLPPKIFKKRVGETEYSLNLIPLGGFVKLEGEEKPSEDERSFSRAPLSKRMAIVLAGVISFWVMSAILFSLIFSLGTEFSILDNEAAKNPKVQVLAVSKNSPAEKAGLKIKDYILGIKTPEGFYKVEKVATLRELTKKFGGKEIVLVVERERKVFETKVIPRENSTGGPLGVVVSRVDFKKYPFYLAPFYGAKETLSFTARVLEGYAKAIKNFFLGKETGMRMVGPLGIFYFGKEALSESFVNYLVFLAQIAVFLAIFNALPLPGLDGGKFLFLLVEGISKKKISEKWQIRIEGAFLAFLISLACLATISDIKMIFGK